MAHSLTALEATWPSFPFGGKEGSVKVIKTYAGHEDARLHAPVLFPGTRLESWSSSEIHQDTGPGRDDAPTMEALLPCQLRDNIIETGIWGSGEGFN